MLVGRMFALNSTANVVTSRLLPKSGELIGKGIFCKNFNCQGNQSVHAPYSRGMTFPASRAYKSTDLTNFVRRQYVTKKTDADALQPTAPSLPPNSNQKSQFEKTFSSLIAFLWDSACSAFALLQKWYKTQIYPHLPPKEQVEKNIFRVIAFIWDYGHLAFSWLQKVFKMHVIDNSTVQHYWKRFHEKMAESKKV